MASAVSSFSPIFPDRFAVSRHHAAANFGSNSTARWSNATTFVLVERWKTGIVQEFTRLQEKVIGREILGGTALQKLLRLW